jgi:regulator of protease activity HflC (stomatin/prohibitin superfamily)
VIEILAIVFAIFAVILVFSAVRVVPQQAAYVVERLGKYDRTLSAGPHIIIPFVDRVSYRHSLKEIVLDIPEQPCITRDNVVVAVDGVLFLRVIDPSRASYGVANFQFAIIQLAQTTLRSEIGKLDLDRTFEARDAINAGVVTALDKATDTWGVKVLRYEIKSIAPPKEVVEAMEKQMRAEREKRAKILESEGDRDSKINRAEGAKQETIKGSEADRQLQINQAEGQAAAILAVASATADGLKQVAAALMSPGGTEAARLRVAEQWVNQFGQLARQSNTMIIPANVSDVVGTLASAFAVFEHSRKGGAGQDGATS